MAIRPIVLDKLSHNIDYFYAEFVLRVLVDALIALLEHEAQHLDNVTISALRIGDDPRKDDVFISMRSKNNDSPDKMAGITGGIVAHTLLLDPDNKPTMLFTTWLDLARLSPFPVFYRDLMRVLRTTSSYQIVRNLMVAIDSRDNAQIEQAANALEALVSASGLGDETLSVRQEPNGTPSVVPTSQRRQSQDLN
jgi:hypothetical protein